MRKYFFFSFLLMMLLPLSTYGQEERVYEIYKKYYDKPISNEAWGRLVSNRKGEIYNVQKGDNLWNLSRTFFGDGYYWTKLWSVNKFSNPHEIAVNSQIQFFRGTEQIPAEIKTTDISKSSEPVVLKNETKNEPQKKLPRLFVEDSPEKQTEVFFPTLEDQGAFSEKNKQQQSNIDSSLLEKIPPPRTPPQPLGKIPPTFPTWYPGYNYKEVRLEISKQNSALENVRKEKFQDYYLDRKGFDSIGEIQSLETVSLSSKNFPLVFLKIVKGPELPKGESFLAVESQGAIYSQSSLETIKVYGELEIVKLLEKRKNFDFYQARIKNALSPLKKGLLLVSKALETVSFEDESSDLSSVFGVKILGGPKDRIGVIFAEQSTVYLDAGTSQGLTAGSVLQFYPNSKNKNLNPLLPSGRIRLTEVGDGISLGVVTWHNGALTQGSETNPNVLKIEKDDGDYRRLEREVHL